VKYLKISIGIFLALAASRFIPHPPNFTSLLALSFYVPAILGLRYIPALILSFAITDLFIGFHGLALFTWGSIIFIGLISRFFLINTKNRIFGCLLGVVIFFIVTNFGVWSLGSYGYTLNGLITCYTLALPFLGNTLVSTIIFSSIIEILIKRKMYIKQLFSRVGLKQ
tara:strand:+ start:1142 stop:1645 length:504 start_codon:yes stop_codon:yes gene_type:complete